MGITFKSPVIFVEDMKRSRQFYEDILNQVIEFDFGANVSYTSGLSLWLRSGANNIIFKKQIDVNKGLDFELYFESGNIETDYDKIKKLEMDMIQELHEEPWGQLTFRFYDPDGYIIEIGESVPAWIIRFFSKGLSVQQIHETTTLPLELIEKTVNEYGKK